MARESTGPERHESFAQSSGIASTYHILKGKTTPHYAQVRTGRAECIPSDPPWHGGHSVVVVARRGVAGSWTATCPDGRAIACDGLPHVGSA